jgi:uncharacterized protein YjaG (DUF416 family)
MPPLETLSYRSFQNVFGALCFGQSGTVNGPVRCAEANFANRVFEEMDILRFNQQVLQDRLSTIDHHERLMAAALCALRLQPFYRSFVKNEGWGDIEAIEAIQNAILEHALSGTDFSEQELGEMIDICQRNTPDGEDFPSYIAICGRNTVLGLRCCLAYCSSHDVKYLADAFSMAIDLLSAYTPETLGLNLGDTQLDEKTYASPLMQSELAFQEHDLVMAENGTLRKDFNALGLIIDMLFVPSRAVQLSLLEKHLKDAGMLVFDRQVVEDRLSIIDHHERLMAAALCALRLQPFYRRFVKSEGWGNIEAIEAIQNAILEHALSGTDFSEQEISEMIDICRKNIPDSDDFPSEIASCGQDAALGLLCCLDYCHTCDLKELSFAFHMAFEAVYFYVPEVLGLDLLNPQSDDKTLDEKIYASPLMQSELVFQEYDLMMAENGSLREHFTTLKERKLVDETLLWPLQT